jgi:hypothetical protein
VIIAAFRLEHGYALRHDDRDFALKVTHLDLDRSPTPSPEARHSTLGDLMSHPKTLLQLAGANPAPAMLSDAALVIIDAQNEYIEGALPLAGVGEAVTSIRALLDRARQAGTPVIHVVHHGRPGGLFDPQGRNGAIVGALAPADGEAVVAKTLPNCFTSAAFRDALTATVRKKIIATGFMTYVRRGDDARRSRPWLCDDRRRRRHRHPRSPRSAWRSAAQRGGNPTPLARRDGRPLCDGGEERAGDRVIQEVGK